MFARFRAVQTVSVATLVATSVAAFMASGEVAGQPATTAVEPARASEPASAPARTSLKSIYAGTHRLEEFATPSTRAIVLVFLGRECPVALQYVPRLVELDRRWAPRGVQFLGVFANAGDVIQNMAIHAHDHDIPFPVLLDQGGRLATQLEVRTTPEAVVLDPQLKKRYQGAIDNQYKKRGRLEAPTEHYLSDALASVEAGRAPTPAETSASGCPIERLRPRREPRDLTFHRDVEPIVQKNCQPCHRTGGVGPFELRTYDDVASNAQKIAEVLEDRLMPPWHGFLNPRFGELKNDKRLDAETLETLLAWIEGGARRGDPQSAPAPIRWPSADAWEIGAPDYVYKIDPFTVPKSGVLEYQFFRVRLNFPEDRWFQAVEVKPGAASVVHHVGLHIVEAGDRKFSGLAGMSALYGINTERGRLINDYLPGDSYNAKRYPPEQAVRIPKNSDLIFEVHYTPNGREATVDQSMAAFQWAAAPPRDEVLTKVFRKAIGGFHVPPRTHHHRAEDTFYFENDVEIDAIRPHFHRRGKSFRLEILERHPETDEIVARTTVLTVPVFDPNWQRTYELTRPLKIPAGAELLTTAHFDNSPLNPNNPDPSATVEWGQQNSDEMFSTRFKYRTARKAAP